MPVAWYRRRWKKQLWVFGAFISSYFKHFSHASLVFDKFHIVKLLNKTLDDTRKVGKNDKKLLKGHRFTFLWRKANLRKDKLEELLTDPDLWIKPTGIRRVSSMHFIVRHPKNRSPILNDGVKQSWTLRSPTWRSLSPPLRTSLVRDHHQLHFSQVSITAYLKVSIKRIQLAKQRARGFANTPNFIDMAYFVCGKLQFDYPYNDAV